MVRVLLADDNISLRLALALMLETRLHAQVVSQVNSVESLLLEAGSTQPDLIIVDMNLPGRYKVTNHIVENLRRNAPKAQIFITSANPDSAGYSAEICADAFIDITDTPDRLLETIKERMQNG